MGIKRIIDDIRTEYKKSKITTVFMGLVVLLAILTYLKPGSTNSILIYIGLSAINFIILGLIIVGIWWFWFRKVIKR